MFCPRCGRKLRFGDVRHVTHAVCRDCGLSVPTLRLVPLLGQRLAASYGSPTSETESYRLEQGTGGRQTLWLRLSVPRISPSWFGVMMAGSLVLACIGLWPVVIVVVVLLLLQEVGQVSAMRTYAWGHLTATSEHIWWALPDASSSVPLASVARLDCTPIESGMWCLNLHRHGHAQQTIAQNLTDPQAHVVSRFWNDIQRQQLPA